MLREENRTRLKARGLVVFLDTSLAIQINRTKKDRKRPLLQNVDHRLVLEEMKAIRDPLYNDVADIRVFVGDSSSKRLVATIVTKMKQLGSLDEQ